MDGRGVNKLPSTQGKVQALMGPARLVLPVQSSQVAFEKVSNIYHQGSADIKKNHHIQKNNPIQVYILTIWPAMF